MGCASSKQKPVCRNCRAPMTRSYSMHVHHPPQTEGDSYHLVALKSSTLGYLQLDPSNSNNSCCIKNHQDLVQVCPEPVRQNATEKENTELSVGIIDAKTWSKMIEEKIPKLVPRTPITTPPGEPETINAWELMEGLDDTSPLRPKFATNHIRSFSFHVNPSSFEEPAPELPENNHQNDMNSVFGSTNNKQVSSEFKKSLELLPPENPFYLKPMDVIVDDPMDVTDSKKSLQNGFDDANDGKNYKNSPPRVKEKLVLYFTSLRGVRKTYEDCCHVRHLLKATGVRVDERDVSMHSGFKEELKELLGGFIGGLPKVFIGKKCIGGAMEIRRMHEDGELEKAVEGCEMVGGGGGCGGGVGCEACGDIRFIPCETCSGSCKIYYEDECDDTDYEEEQEESDYGFQRCPDCNENGLVRCPICCD
ncbi:putative glutaredoxin, Thioredoxin-like superfamily [Helianthus annuus]|nr:putative glutaredoxin, Thioredoxin-like superfamily [Helianthus annuus]